jgi:two-component system sensor histidine kinase GlrK
MFSQIHLQYRMRIQYPNSFLKLLLIGFAFAILPLIFAFINANIAFSELSKKSQNTIDMAVKATRASQVLQEQLHLMERSARQYFVLSDFELLENYKASRLEFIEALHALMKLNAEPAQLRQLQTIEELEFNLHVYIMHADIGSLEDMPFLSDFRLLAQKVDEIILLNNQRIDNASLQLAKSASKAQQRFSLQSLILIPFALLVAGVLAFMLGRPIQRMDNAIENLGKGEYQHAITIDGPGNLRLLGSRLNWLREELLHLKEQKQRFLQHISHELKTPLTAIREATELLTDGVGGALSPQQSEITQILKDNSIRLQKMIENLLSFTKMESDKHVLNIKLLNVEEIVNTALDSHALSIRAKSIHIETFYFIDTMTADAETLRVVLDNLISNAVKFTPEHGLIIISSRYEKPWQVIEIQDNGPGISQEDMERLFDPFYQGKTLHQGLVNSSGLGLTIVNHLVETHQGEVELVQNTKGAHIVVKLPILES